MRVGGPIHYVVPVFALHTGAIAEVPHLRMSAKSAVVPHRF